MMRVCQWDGCKQWAQWHAVFQDSPKIESRTRVRLCQKHKDEHKKEGRVAPVNYIFVGAEFNGPQRTQ